MIESIECSNSNIWNGFETDCFKTANGSILQITFIKHACLMFNFNGQVIYTDPVSTFADFSTLPKADVILITHQHSDHLDPKAIAILDKPTTLIISNKASYDIIERGIWMKNGDQLSPYPWLMIKAVPAYNITPDRMVYHPKNRDNGYVLTLGGSKIYISGDTEDIPDLEKLKDIDIAFISVNQPYTMTTQQAAHAIKMIHAKITYPYHYTDTDLSPIENDQDLANYSEIRIRQLQ